MLIENYTNRIRYLFQQSINFVYKDMASKEAHCSTQYRQSQTSNKHISIIYYYSSSLDGKICKVIKDAIDEEIQSN